MGVWFITEANDSWAKTPEVPEIEEATIDTTPVGKGDGAGCDKIDDVSDGALERADGASGGATDDAEGGVDENASDADKDASVEAESTAEDHEVDAEQHRLTDFFSRLASCVLIPTRIKRI